MVVYTMLRQSTSVVHDWCTMYHVSRFSSTGHVQKQNYVRSCTISKEITIPRSSGGRTEQLSQMTDGVDTVCTSTFTIIVRKLACLIQYCQWQCLVNLGTEVWISYSSHSVHVN